MIFKKINHAKHLYTNFCKQTRAKLYKMKNIKYYPKSRKIKVNINGTILNLNPVIRALDLIGRSIIQKPENKNNIQIVHHDRYLEVCPYQLHGSASMACDRFRDKMPNLDPEIIDFASTEIGLGNVSILKLDYKHKEQILIALDDIGKTWQYTEDKEEAEAEIRKYGIPLLISTKGLSEKERRKKFRLDHIFINEKSLAKNAVNVYDEVMLSEKHNNKERFESLDLDNIAIGIGLNLYEAGLVDIKLYEEN